jgi:hypothetical protein
MREHSYRLHYQTTYVQRARDKLTLRFHIYRDGQANEIRILHTVLKKYVSKGPRIPI